MPQSSTSARQPSPDGDATQCHHCGLPLPAAGAVAAAGEAIHRFCCHGCAAVSRSIAELGLDDYYRLRDTVAPRAADPPVDPAAFDEPAVRARYVTRLPGGDLEARLLVEGMRCAACAWLLEQALLRTPGVQSVVVQFAARRVTVRWSPGAAGTLAPSALIRAIGNVGYVAWPFEEGRIASIENRERRTLLRRLWVAGLSMMQVMMYAVPGYIALDGEMTADAEALMRWAGMLLTLPVLLYSAVPFFAGAWRDVRIRTLGMDVPVAIGIAVAFAASAVATLSGAGAVYFDSVAMFVFLLLGARYLEAIALGKAGQALASLGRIVPEQAHRLLGRDGLVTETVLASALVRGDRVLVRPGETLPADGVLDSAEATLSEAWMTGESRPLARRRGDAVRCGAINAGSAIVVEIARVGADTVLSGIVRLIERSLAERPRWVAAAERAVPVFIAAILAIALAAFCAWWLVDPTRAVAIAVAVLIVTCPCALALATPVAVTVATGALARSGVAVTRSSAIEALAAVTDVVFDKTGTLTTGRPTLVEIIALDGKDSAHALRIAAAIAQGSSHPLDTALREAAGRDALPPAQGHAAVAGQGIEAQVGDVRHRLGRAAFAGALAGAPAPIAILGANDSTAWLASERGWIAAFRFRDVPRADARDAIGALERLGIRLHVLSGDDDVVVRDTAAALGIAQIRARATPADKCAFVRSLQQNRARVAMIGDGINDAPVLAQADVSIAMQAGADLAKINADAVLLSNAPGDVASAIRIARQTRAVIRQNLAWALGYNLVVIPLAVAGQLSPLIAGLGMSLSSLLVVVNSLRAR